MFTGIITDVGTVSFADGGRFRIACGFDAASIDIGASIACDGCCLTVVELTKDADGAALFDVDVSHETLSRTTLGKWTPGRQVNLERSLKLADELGGHIVTGHIDGVAQIVSTTPDGDSVRFEFECPAPLAPFIAPKGSVALDGTSLTVNTVERTRFTVNLIPHSLAVTTWGQKRAGDEVNLEVDLFARYIARLLSAEKEGLDLPSGHISL